MKVITFIFSKPLNPNQHKTFVTYINNTTEAMRQKIKTMGKAYDNPALGLASKITGMDAIANGIKTQVNYIHENMYDYVRLEQPKENEYTLSVNEGVLKISAPGKTINLWEKIESKYGFKFKLEICKNLGLMPGELKISFSEQGGGPSITPSP